MKPRKLLSQILLTVVLMAGVTTAGIAQPKAGTSYYVSAKQTVLYQDTAATTALQQLKKHDNLSLLQALTNGWMKVRLVKTKTTGFVRMADTDRGRAVAEYSRYRTGAVCEDGSRSTATGRGACSWHGGVARWLYRTNTWYRIVDDE